MFKQIILHVYNLIKVLYVREDNFSQNVESPVTIWVKINSQYPFRKTAVGLFFESQKQKQIQRLCVIADASR